MFQLVAYSPEKRPFNIGLGQQRLEHALQDRDSLRKAHDRHKTFGWSVVVEDGDGRVMEWADCEAHIEAGVA